MEICEVEKRAEPQLFSNSKLGQSELLKTYLEETVQGWGNVADYEEMVSQRCFRMKQEQ